MTHGTRRSNRRRLRCNAGAIAVTSPARRGLRLVLPCCLALSLAGCSVSSFFDPALPPASREPEAEPNYRQIVAADFAQHLADHPAIAALEVSDLRRSLGPQPGAWMACVRQVKAAQNTAFAVFIEDHKIVNVRQAVALDGCDQERFQLISTPAATTPK